MEIVLDIIPIMDMTFELTSLTLTDLLSPMNPRKMPGTPRKRPMKQNREQKLPINIVKILVTPKISESIAIFCIMVM